MEIFIIFALILLNGIFSMSEMALISSRKTRLEIQAEKGSKTAKNAIDLINTPNKFLSAVQISITLVGILTGVFSGEKITDDIILFLNNFESLQPYSKQLATAITVISVTYFSLVFGELVPKRLGMSNAERIAKIVAMPMKIFSKITSPFVWLLGISTNAVLKVLNIKKTLDNAVTEEEIKALVEEGKTTGNIEPIEQDIVENAFNLGDRKINSIMTHRQDIVWLDIKDDFHIAHSKIKQTPHSVYPLCNGSIDHVVGFVHLRDLFGVSPTNFNLEEAKRQALFIPEFKMVYSVLEKFKDTKIHQALVVDEFGAVQGLATINDIFDSLVRDMSEMHEFDYEIVKRNENSYLIDAQLPFDDFANHFKIKNFNKDDFGDFSTLGGFILAMLEDMPKTGDRLVWKEYEFEIVDMDKSRIDKIMVTRNEVAAS